MRRLRKSSKKSKKMSLLIKVCGLKNPENTQSVLDLEVDMIGHIFYEKSPRFIETPYPIVRKNTRRVGVFVDADIPFILDKIRNFDLDAIQLHGSETVGEIIDLIFEMMKNDIHKILIIKAIAIETIEDLAKAKQYETFANYILFDTKTPKHGGSGQKFDWSILDYYDSETPFILSGGIGIDDLENIRKIKHEKLIGIDLNSRFELEPGLKNIATLTNFISEIHKNE